MDITTKLEIRAAAQRLHPTVQRVAEVLAAACLLCSLALAVALVLSTVLEPQGVTAVLPNGESILIPLKTP